MATIPEQIADSVQVENVVTSCGIDMNLDLAELADDLSNAEFDAERFPGLIYRTADPKVTTLVFRSGKIICTGSKRVDGSESAIEELMHEFETLGIQCDSPTVEIQNVVGVADVGCKLNLNAIAIGLGLENTEYEPEQFPGLVYRMDDPSVVSLLFGSGKVVITGAKTREEVAAGVEELHQQLEQYALLN